jgi:hypothetical protein
MTNRNSGHQFIVICAFKYVILKDFTEFCEGAMVYTLFP